jgi:hypothetical protein
MKMTPEHLEISINTEGKIYAIVPSIPRLYKYGIYIFYHKNRLIRIGETASGFTRIYKGFSSPLRLKNGKKNYYAYSWRQDYRNEKIRVVYFSLDQLDKEAEKPEVRRSIEAEIAFQIRLKSEKWPVRMTEIHFSEKLRSNRKIKTVVNEIVESIV